MTQLGRFEETSGIGFIAAWMLWKDVRKVLARSRRLVYVQFCVGTDMDVATKDLGTIGDVHRVEEQVLKQQAYGRVRDRATWQIAEVGRTVLFKFML